MLALSLAPPVRAQSEEAGGFTMVLRGVPLEEALSRFATLAQVNLVYEERLVQGRRIFCTAKDASAEALLRCMLRGTDLDFYQTSSGTYVLTEATRQPPRYGYLVGVVVDAATGEPLPYAHVLLADAGVGTAANAAGLFSFSSLASGPHQVVTTYVGYATTVDSVWVPPGGRVQQRITLKAQPVTAAPVVINGLEQRLPSETLAYGTLSAEALAAPRSVGTPDVLRSASSLLGVTLREPLADLHIQGAAASAHQVRLEGVPIRNPVTLGRLLGAFSPLAVERLVVHKAGFGAAYGSRLSGILALEHDLGDAHGQTLTVQVDPLSFNGRAHGQLELPGSLKASVLAAVRTSLWSLYRDPTLTRLLREWRTIDPLLFSPQIDAGEDRPAMHADRRRADVAFSDIHLATRLHLTPFHTVDAFLYHGRNRIAAASIVAADSNALLFTRDRYHWRNWAGQVRYRWLLGARLLGTVRLYGTRQSLGHGFRMGRPEEGAAAATASSDEFTPYDGNKVNEGGLEVGLDYALSAHHHLSGALKGVRVESRALIGDGFFRPLSYAATRWRLAGFVQDEVSLGVGTILKVGTRLTYAFDRRTLYAEPRLAVRHDGTHPKLGTYALRLAGGLYRQFVSRFELSSPGPTALVPALRIWLPTGRDLAPPRAYHLATEVLLKPGAGWQFNLEAYYKWLPYLAALNYPALLADHSGEAAPKASFVAPSRGRAFGAGLRLHHEGEHFEGTVSYSFSRSVRTVPGRFEGRLEPTPWNQPHRLSLEGRLALTSRLTAWTNWRGVWGRTWAFRPAYYDYLALEAPPGAFAPFNLDNPSAQELSPFYRLDLGLAYQHAWEGFTVEVRAALINVLNRRNVFDWSLHPTEASYEKIARRLPGRRPLLSLRIAY